VLGVRQCPVSTEDVGTYIRACTGETCMVLSSVLNAWRAWFHVLPSMSHLVLYHHHIITIKAALTDGFTGQFCGALALAMQGVRWSI
jgi:hypothetical protein